MLHLREDLLTPTVKKNLAVKSGRGSSQMWSGHFYSANTDRLVLAAEILQKLTEIGDHFKKLDKL